MKVLVAAHGLYTYPDAMLVCGKVEFAPGRKDVVANPLLIVEVLSDSTQSYDRGDSFAHYLLVHQDRPLVEHHQRTERGWLPTEVAGLDASLDLETIDLSIPLHEVFVCMDWLEEAA